MKLKAVLSLLLAFFLIAGTAHAGRKANFIFTDLNGGEYTPATLKGRPLVIYVGSHL
ncbi:MAG: hypothetical protein MUO63_11170 [Desulfobulbaceae bacterium]|nr:hypothetical protein [Desulfobulbaceae bacterium]